MNPNIEVISKNLLGVNFYYVKMGWIKEINAVCPIDPAQTAGTITDTGHIILNNFHPAYGELKKLLPGIMGKPDDELRRNFATLVVKKQKQPLEKWEQLFLDILEWELKRRTMITKQWKRKGKVKKNGYFAKWH